MKRITILPILLATAVLLVSATIAQAESQLTLTATASGYYRWESAIGVFEYPPANLIDNNLYNYWQGDYPADNWWLQLDCGGIYELCSVAIWWRAGYGSPDYDIQISTDGNTWTNIYTALNTTGYPSGTATKNLAVHPLSINTRFVRVYINQAEFYHPHIAEVKIFGGSTAVNQKPIADITYNSTMRGSVPLDTSFTETSVDFDGSIVSYSWVFGDGATSTEQNPTHTYNNSGYYTAKLTVTDDDGATDIDTMTVIVDESSNQAPIASANADKTSGYAPLTIQFNGSGTDADGTVASYHWVFGDGGIANIQNPTYTYHNSGVYNVVLTVTDDKEASATDSITVTVNEPTNQSPTASAAANLTTIEVGQSVQFTGSGTDSDGTIASYSWDFGDGTTSTEQNPAHAYNNSGNYNVTLTVTDDDGATGSDSVAITVNEAPNQSPTAAASANPTTIEVGQEVQFTGSGTDSDGSIASYSWDFGDGATSNEQNPTHIYNNSNTYTATLTVTDDDGATGADSLAITVNEVPNQSPAASASASPTTGNVPLQVTFTGGGTDSDGSITSYNWDFGDGVTSNSQNTSHTYNNTGIYNVTLTVTDDDGATGTDSLAITVNEAPNEPPAANASGLPTSGEAPLEVAFTGGGSDSDGNIAGYSWDFGDGASSLSQNPIHTYDSAGTYMATLTATDDDGAIGNDTVLITVNETPNQPPQASASANPVTGEAPLEVQFTGAATDSDGTIVSYSWDFGDGIALQEQNPTHIYQEPGQYTAVLTVQDDDAAQATDSIAISVEEPTPVTPSISKEIPHLIRFQARLTDKNNTSLNGYYNVTFRIYDAEIEGSLLWEKLYDNLEVTNGTVNALLDIDLPFDAPYWLSLDVNGETMDPRQPITSTAYSYRAEFAKKGGTVAYADQEELSAATSSKLSIHLEDTPSSVRLYIWGELAQGGSYPDDVTIAIDGADVTAGVLTLANDSWSSSESALGDGTGSHPLISGTGELDITDIATWSKGEHKIEFSQSGATKGQIRYNLYISY